MIFLDMWLLLFLLVAFNILYSFCIFNALLMCHGIFFLSCIFGVFCFLYLCEYISLVYKYFHLLFYWSSCLWHRAGILLPHLVLFCFFFKQRSTFPAISCSVLLNVFHILCLFGGDLLLYPQILIFIHLTCKSFSWVF